ncbi:MAG: hypothetical protein GX446_07880 [Chthonomonadales bacterium]|nr:hypothetical protein [Chthonomonadales bacterium]
MWIGNVDLPQDVLDAAEAGTLVVFVGAGASRATPSDLPDFAGLVRSIGAQAARNPTDDEVKHPDVFLGRLEDAGVDVHRLVASAINHPGSQPNRLHSAIAALAAACPCPRLVTTNYDRHLTSAARAQGLDLDVYKAPALPVGDDFEGIVHLHGSLDQPSRRLVVTDGDFGKAYLREAWAARFLERMFAAFTVLFIGYSHGDLVMQYLARSLGPSRHRFVLTDDPRNTEWRRLGLTPIAYPNAAGDHSELPATIERWVQLASMRQMEHRARIATLLSGEPPTIPEEASYLEGVLGHAERIRYFSEKARFEDAERSLRWLTWIEGCPAFQDLFSREASSSVTSQVLLSWIAEQYIVNESSSGVALRAFREESWPTDTWYSITQALLAHKGEFPKWLSPWFQLVLQKAPSRQHDLLDMMLANKDWSTNFDLALMLFEDRTRPLLKRAFDFGGPADSPRFKVDLCGDEYWLTDNWIKVFKPMLDDHLEQLLSLVSEQIAGVYRSLRALDPGGTFDPISFSRSAIERHEQDDRRDAIDVLIDAARDCIEAAMSSDLSLGRCYLDAWFRSRDLILRRLAVHGWRVRTDVDSDEKLSWLRREQLLWDAQLQHEVFQLIRDTFPSASDTAARSLVEDAVAGPLGEANHESTPYRILNLLGWLAATTPSRQVATQAFEAAQEAHPEYDRREHPDFSHYGSFGFVENALPFSAAELHDLMDQSPADALARLRAFQSERHAIEGPTWAGALRSLQACVTAYPEDGMRAALAMQPEDSDIRESLISGWGRARLKAEMIERVLEVISRWDHDEIRRSACDMFSSGGRPERPTEWHQIAPARQLASDLWPGSEVDGAILSGADMLTEAINHPAGDLAQFWTKVVQWEWTQNEPEWSGIPPGVVTELDRLVSAQDRNGLLAQTFLASQLYFFFGADREWCETRLLPLFD